MNPQLEGVGLRPEDVLHGDLECLAVLPVRREDAEAWYVAVGVAGQLVQAVRLVATVPGAGSQDQVIHLPLDERPGLPAHPHLHAGVRPGARLEPGLRVQIEPGRARHGEVDRSRVGDLLNVADDIGGVTHVLPVILVTISLLVVHSSICPHLKDDIVED